MSDKDSYEFYVGKGTVLQGASLEISGTAKIDGTIVGTVGVNHLIVGPTGVVQGDISGETAEIEGVVEDSLALTGKLTVRASGRIRGKISYGSLEAIEGAKLVGEISTDWGADNTTMSSDRLDQFTTKASTTASYGGSDQSDNSNEED